MLKSTVSSFRKTKITPRIDNTALLNKKVKDMGIWSDSSHSFDHMSIIVRKSYLAQLTAKGITIKTKEVIVPLYSTLIRPIIKYNFLIGYAPHSKKKTWKAP